MRSSRTTCITNVSNYFPSLNFLSFSQSCLGTTLLMRKTWQRLLPLAAEILLINLPSIYFHGVHSWSLDTIMTHPKSGHNDTFRIWPQRHIPSSEWHWMPTIQQYRPPAAASSINLLYYCACPPGREEWSAAGNECWIAGLFSVTRVSNDRGGPDWPNSDQLELEVAAAWQVGRRHTTTGVQW